MPSLSDIANDEEHKVGTFENNPGWNPELGALRIGLLP
jgi:hypothetical protein